MENKENRKHSSPARASSLTLSPPPAPPLAAEQPMETSPSRTAEKRDRPPHDDVVGSDNDHLPEELRDRANDCFGQSSDVSENKTATKFVYNSEFQFQEEYMNVSQRLERYKDLLYSNDGLYGQAMGDRAGHKRARIEGAASGAPASASASATASAAPTPATSAPTSAPDVEAPGRLWTPDDESKSTFYMILLMVTVVYNS